MFHLALSLVVSFSANVGCAQLAACAISRPNAVYGSGSSIASFDIKGSFLHQTMRRMVMD